MRLWNLHTGELLQTLRHTNWVVSVAFSSDGTMLVSGSEYGTLRLWDVQTGVCLRVPFSQTPVRLLALSQL